MAIATRAFFTQGSTDSLSPLLFFFSISSRYFASTPRGHQVKDALSSIPPVYYSGKRIGSERHSGAEKQPESRSAASCGKRLKRQAYHTPFSPAEDRSAGCALVIMDQHQHRDRLSSQSERELDNPICLPVSDPHKAHSSPSTCSACASPSPSTSAYPSTSAPSHRHLPPANTSTPQTNEANALFPPHYITSSFSTPRRTSSVLPSPFLVPSPALPTLLTMSPQVLAPPLPALNPPIHDQPRPSSRSERLLRETLRRDRAASLSPRSRMPRPDFSSGRIASTSTSSEMFHCACADGDEEADQPLGTSHVSLLFANLPQHQQRPPPLQRSAKSSADVHSMRRRESEKEPMPPLFHINPPHRGAVTHGPLEGYLYGAADAQTRDRHPDRESVWSSAEVSTRLPLSRLFFSPETISPDVGFSSPSSCVSPLFCPFCPTSSHRYFS